MGKSLLTDEVIEAAKDLRKKGMIWRDIADKLGHRGDTLRKAFDRLGIGTDGEEKVKGVPHKRAFMSGFSRKR